VRRSKSKLTKKSGLDLDYTTVRYGMLSEVDACINRYVIHYIGAKP
jgi:hypothetical protein